MHEIIEGQKKEINELYSNYTTMLISFLNEECLFDDVHSAGESFFSYLEQCTAQNNSTENLKESTWNQWLAETCIDVLELISQHYKTYRTQKNDNTLSPSSTAFAAMQRLVKRYDPEKAKLIREQFKKMNLPVYGFDKKGKSHMTKTHERWAAFCFGIFFIVFLLVVAIFIPTPSQFQYTLFRIVLSLAAAGFTTFAPGFIEVKFSTWLRAGGALAIFAVVYWIAPAAL